MTEENSINQYLSFQLSSEVFGLEINKVREVLDFTSLNKVPQTPAYMRGVINLRGAVVPVIDLRLKFGMTQAERTVKSCIIITEVDFSGELMVLGALADSVQEVLDLEPEQIEAAPKIGSKLNTSFIKGIAKQNEEFIILLDIDQVFSEEEISVAQAVQAEKGGKQVA